MTAWYAESHSANNCESRSSLTEMDAHVTGTDIRRWKRGEVSPDEVVSIARHLSACTECRALGENEWSLRDLELELEAIDEHPNQDELLAYAEGTLPAARRASVASHVIACARCREDIDDRRQIIGSQHSRWPRLALGVAVAAALVFMIVTALLPGRRKTELPHVVSTTAPPTPTVTTAPPTPPDEMARLDPSLRLVAASLIGGSLPSAAILSALQPATERERGTRTDDIDFSVVSPIGEVVGDARPLFRWRGSTGRFSVEIFDERMQLIAESPPLAAHEWRPAVPLPRSQILTWAVRLEAKGRSLIAPRPPDPPARFRIASSSAIDAARTTESALEAALIYAREGMIDEARRKMREASSGSASEEIRKMLATLDAAAAQRSRPTTMNGAQ